MLTNATHDYIHDKAPQRVWNARTVLSLMKEKAEVVFHGGTNSSYPIVDSAVDSNQYDPMYDGAIGTIETPVSNDLTRSLQQEGWGYFKLHESMSHKDYVINGGPWASKEKVISAALLKEDSLMDRIGNLYEYNIVEGDATNDTIIGLDKLFNIANTNYLGMDFTGAYAAWRPKNVTVATTYTNLVVADLIAAYGEIEDVGKYADVILHHPNILGRLRTLAENTVDRTQGGNVSFGALKFDTLGAEHVVSRRMPYASTACRIYFMNFGNHVGRGIMGKDSPQVDEGKYFMLEFAGPKAIGCEISGWEKLGALYPGVVTKYALGAFKMACTLPEAQAYISVV